MIEGMPKDIEEYKMWLKKSHKIELSKKTAVYYDSVTSKIKSDFESSNFWITLNSNLKNLNEKYQLENNGYKLFIDASKPEVFVKSFDSFLLKTYRKNILENKNWPEPPINGWILPDNWFGRIPDIIRTRFVVKYIDGVDNLINYINSCCDQCDLYHNVDLEAREEGYYAAHLYVKQKFEIPCPTWDTETINASIEIQVMTQLQEVIITLLHKYYENSRKKINKEEKWQWNYKSDEFAANYLGHILHYVEGMIVEIRDKDQRD